MARALRIEYPGAHYHVTARGNERKDVFKSQKDREQFLSYLESAVNRYEAVIHAYCLMSNHYHLLLETPSGNLSKIMQHNVAPLVALVQQAAEHDGEVAVAVVDLNEKRRQSGAFSR